MEDRPFSFEAQGQAFKRQQLSQAGAVRYASAGKSLEYTPTLLTSGPYTATGQGIYVRHNNLVNFWFTMSAGGMDPADAGGNWRITLPVVSANKTPNVVFPIASCFVADQPAIGFNLDGLAEMTITCTGGLAMSATVPVAWEFTFGLIAGFGSYEAESGYNA